MLAVSLSCRFISECRGSLSPCLLSQIVLWHHAGTPLFLPPEMFMRHWGPEADLWSLGMVTYLLLSGAYRLPIQLCTSMSDTSWSRLYSVIRQAVQT